MGYFCNECKRGISLKEYKFSKEKYSRALCLNHQLSLGQGKAAKLSMRQVYIIQKRTPTPQAKKLAEALKIMGWKPELEKFDGYKHIDIAIVRAKVNIEVDGNHHNTRDKQALIDLKRALHSFKKGYLTLRIPNCLVKNEITIKETAQVIDKFLKASLDQLESEGDF